MEQAATQSAPRRELHLRARFTASAIHFSISLLLVGGLVAVMMLNWFPPPLFQVDGGWQGLRIVFLVDLVLGPGLMFLAFNPAKRRRELITDISIIALLQLAAFGWGIHALETQRPRVVVSDGTTLYAIVLEDITKQKVGTEVLDPYRTTTPPFAFSREPANEQETAELVARMFTMELPEYAAVDRLQPFKEHAAQALKNPVTSAQMEKDSQLKAQITSFLTDHGGSFDSYRFMRYIGKYGTAILAFQPSGEYVGGFVNELNQ